MKSKNKTVLILVMILLLLFSSVAPASAATSYVKGQQYDDAVFELEEKLALWENYGEDPETRDLERLRDVFSDLSGSTAQHSKGFRLYLDVLIGIAYCSYDSVDSSLYQIEKSTDFRKYLETIHGKFVHIGTFEQLQNYAEGRKNQYLGEEASNEKEEMEYNRKAITAYQQCEGWLDSAARNWDLNKAVEAYLQRVLSKVQKNVIVKFGQYTQRFTDLEKIEWIILSVDKSNGTVKLLSRYLLDCVQYHTKDSKVAWKDSYIRNWLNNEFYNNAFSYEEQQTIVQTYSSGSLDYVTMLDQREIESGNFAQGCEATPYAVSKGIDVGSDNGLSCWWVRADTVPGNTTFWVGIHGGIHTKNRATIKNNGVRPVITVDLFSFLNYATF